MTTLPIRQITLHKHGVGFFQREGEVEGEEVTLRFNRRDFNDVLKSLVVHDRSGGQVLGIGYTAQPDKAPRPTPTAVSKMKLSERQAMLDLLRDLRGRSVTLTVQGEEVRGRLLGLNEPVGEHAWEDWVVVLAPQPDQVSVYKMTEITGLTLHDERAEQELATFLDTLQQEGAGAPSDPMPDERVEALNYRSLRLRLSAGNHDLVIGYLVTSPTWRVSYRLIAQSADGDGSSGEILLQGWALFDNQLEEDLEDVAVTLVAGQAISFVYDLSTGVIPERTEVKDMVRTAKGPVEYRSPRPAHEQMSVRLDNALYPRRGGLLGLFKRRSPANPAERLADIDALIDSEWTPAEDTDSVTAMLDDMLGAAPARPRLSSSGVRDTTPAAAQGQEAQEFFQYVVTDPVTVKQGGSAMVPIVRQTLDYERELLYNGSKFPDHPVAALRFTNATGLTLERGPVTVMEDGEYKGEAIIPFTLEGGDLLVPFAAEPGVEVREDMDVQLEIISRTRKGQYASLHQHQILTITYHIENRTAHDRTVIVESAVDSDWELLETREPDVETDVERRWRIAVPAGETVDFQRRERREHFRHVQRGFGWFVVDFFTWPFRFIRRVIGKDDADA